MDWTEAFLWILCVNNENIKTTDFSPIKQVNSLIVYGYSYIKSCIPGELYRVTGTFKCASVSTEITRVNCKRDNHND